MNLALTKFAVVLLCGASAFACSKSRAPIKQLKDAGVANIDFSPKVISVADLLAIARPAEADQPIAQTKRLDSEKQVYRVNVQVLKTDVEQDGDMKLHVAAPGDSTKSFIIEVPEAECVAPKYRNAVERLARDLKKQLQASAHPLLRFDGVLFWGYVRANDSAANGVQLHPVLAVRSASPR